MQQSISDIFRRPAVPQCNTLASERPNHPPAAPLVATAAQTPAPSLRSHTAEQLRAIEAGNGFYAVEAGPGSGKTRTITARMRHLIDVQQVPAERILALTFSRKACDEMVERLGKGRPVPFVRTFHSFCSWLLQQDGAAVGVPPGFKTLSEFESGRIVRELLDGGGEGCGEGGEVDGDPKAIHAAIMAMKRADVQRRHATAGGSHGSSGVATSAAEERRVRELCWRYQERLLQMSPRRLDFDDLLLYALELLAQDGPRRKYASRFVHVLIDEFQEGQLHL